MLRRHTASLPRRPLPHRNTAAKSLHSQSLVHLVMGEGAIEMACGLPAIIPERLWADDVHANHTELIATTPPWLPRVGNVVIEMYASRHKSSLSDRNPLPRCNCEHMVGPGPGANGPNLRRRTSRPVLSSPRYWCRQCPWHWRMLVVPRR